MANESLPLPALLDAAAKLIERVLDRLDAREARCDTCRSRVFRNPDQMKVYERLREMPEKLRANADKLKADRSAAPAGTTDDEWWNGRSAVIEEKTS